MTGFLIEVDFDQPLRPKEQFRSMLDGLKFKGRSGLLQRSFAGVQLGLSFDCRDALDAEGVELFYDEQSEALIVVDARLDAAQELVEKLQYSHGARLDAGAVAELLMAAYARWGEQFPEHVQGDFSCCVVHFKERRVLAVRDRFGMRKLFYRQASGRLTVSNHLGSILSAPDFTPELDWTALSDFLLFGNVNELDTALTPYSEIRMVPHASTLLWVASGRQSQRSYWRLPTQVELLPYRSERDVLDHFDSAMAAAIEDRLQVGSAVLALSGGLDSTTIAWFAADLWKRGKGPDRLTALTAVGHPDHPEALLAAQVSKTLGLPHVVHVVQRGRPSLDHQQTPFPNTNLHGYQQSTLKRVSELGEISLVGHAGDYALAPESGVTVMDMFRLQGPKRALAALFALRRQFKYRPPWGTGLLARVNGYHTALPARPSPEFPSWIKAGHVDAFDLEARWQLYWQRRQQPGAHALRPAAFGWFSSYNHWAMREEDWSLPFSPALVSDPYLDFRVLELLWRLPPLPWYHKKYLLRKAMRDRLPPEVTQRPKTPAGKWLSSEGALPFPAPFQPHPKLERVVDIEKMPSREHRPSRPVEVFPYFLDSWLRSGSSRGRAGESD
jgi:asparagine synthase (glutamine-hydrolysing)